MTKTLLLTGATGFVGRQVLRLLRTQGYQLRIVARTSTVRTVDWSPECEVITSADIFSEPPNWWASAARGVDAALHMAWYAEPGQYLQSPLNLCCLRGTLSMAQGCAEAGVKRFVGVGSCFEYDTSHGYLSTRTPLRPTSPYAASKAAAYLFLREYFRECGVSFAWCRLFYLFGEGEDPRRLVPYVRQQLQRGEPVELTSGTQVRDYLNVRDAACELVEHLLGSREGPINICSASGKTVRELVEQVADEYGRRDLLRFGVRPDNLIDPAVVVGVKD